VGLTVTYLALVELAKARFYAARAHTVRTRPTREQRREHRIHRRAHRFTRRRGPRVS
jgi:hypothetical protein